jgi:hypothetical protein
VDALTDSSGFFNINPANKGGYNILPTSFQLSSPIPYALVKEPSGVPTSVNPVFQNMFSMGISLEDLSLSEETRLHGMNQFLATDESGVAIAEAYIRVVVVLWN